MIGRLKMGHRRTGILFATGLLLLGLAASSSGGLRFSHHDFSGKDWADNQICLPCHTPHNANQTVPQSPLWNHQVTSASFQVYTSPTLDALPLQPGGVSKLCLSCHDGTIALDAFGGRPGGTAGTISGHVIGTDLTKHHPISMVYDSALAAADGDLYDPSAAGSGLGGTIRQDLLFNGRLECSSCHDVHVSRNTEGCMGCHSVHGGFSSYMVKTLSLRKDNAGSALCLTCHKK